MLVPRPAREAIESGAFIPSTAHDRNCLDEETRDLDAGPPDAEDPLSAGNNNNNNNTKSKHGIRTSQPSSQQDVDYHASTPEASECLPQHPHRRRLQAESTTTSASSDIHPDHDDPETQQANAHFAANLHADLPAWAVAALQETLEQPWKVHFDGSDDRAVDPDFGTGSDPVPFYDGRLKVCYGEGSMAA